MELKVKRISKDATLPTRATPGSAGFDLYASEDTFLDGSCYSDWDQEVYIHHKLIATGLIIEIPSGYVGRIGSRSGLSVKHNIEVGAGWIDSDYRGELKVELKNFSDVDFNVKIGDRIAQLIILPLPQFEIVECEDLGDTTRGNGGFGSTGK